MKKFTFITLALIALVAGIALSVERFELAGSDTATATPEEQMPQDAARTPAWLTQPIQIASPSHPKIANPPTHTTLKEILDNAAPHGVIVNFWATWCPPCIDELPLFDAHQARLQAQDRPHTPVVAIAVDNREAVERFLAKHPLPHLTVLVAGADGLTLIKDAGNSTGQLPYTKVLNRMGHGLHEHTGALNAEEIAALHTHVQSELP